MTTKHEVIALHRKHPKWTSIEIAALLGCHSAYVRATAQRNGLKLPVTNRPAGKGAASLGRRCVQLGLSVQDIDKHFAHRRHTPN